MAQNTPARWIIAYDIGHRKRWAPIYKLLKKQGIPLQYSVFQIDASAAQLAALMAQLSQLIDHKADDIRAYRVPQSVCLVLLGKSMLPEGVWLTAETPRKG